MSCPEGLQAMYDAYPHVKVVTAWVDEKLNEHKYIVPGLGGELARTAVFVGLGCIRQRD